LVVSNRRLPGRARPLSRPASFNEIIHKIEMNRAGNHSARAQSLTQTYRRASRARSAFFGEFTTDFAT